MIVSCPKKETCEQKLLSWASVGLLIFVSAFLWAPSRDGLQGVYVLAFFLPIAIILFFRKPNFNEYGGWPTIIALTYAGFSTLSSLWGEPKDFGFFVLQWLVLAAWLCGSCLVFSKREINVEKYLDWFVALGVLITIISIVYYTQYVYGKTNPEARLYGWNVFRNANEIGAMCGIIALIAFSIALNSRRLKRASIFYFFTFLASIGLVASFSRGALLAFVIMSTTTIIIVRPSIKFFLLLMFLAVSALIVLLSATDVISSYTVERGQALGLITRSNIWAEVLHRCRENIFIGVGMTKDTNLSINFKMFSHAHNAWLDTLFRTGLIGLILVLLHLKKVLQEFSCDSRLLPLYLWLGYGCICHLVDGRSLFWEIGAKWFLYWIPVGLIVAIGNGHIMRKKM